MSGLSPQQKLKREKLFYSWVGALLMGGILLALNFIVGYFPVRWDSSEGGIYSLSQGSKDILKKLEDTLLVQVVF